jgi:hypothetical protein
MRVESSLGDVVDRVTILRLKEARIADPARVAHVRDEIAALEVAWTADGHPPMASLTEWKRLCEVNAALWDVEDRLREHERDQEFGPEFVALARSVYLLNDERAALKRAVNVTLGSRLVEEKSYASYDPTGSTDRPSRTRS